MRYEATVEGKTFQIEVTDAGDVFVDGVKHTPDFRPIDGLALYSLLVDNNSYEMLVEEEGSHFHVLAHGEPFAVRLREVADVKVKSLRDDRMSSPQGNALPAGPIEMPSPIPGVVVDIPVKPGDEVQAGQLLLVVESMKMENELRAPVDGVVREIRIAPEDDVEQGQVLLVFEVK